MFCMAVWLSGTVIVAIVAMQNFYTIYRLMDLRPNPVFAGYVEKIGPEVTNELLRYLSSELNRLYFQYWNLAQLAIGILTLWLVVKIPEAARSKWQIVAMLGIVIFMTVLITPGILSVGRSIDFVPRNPPPPALRTFGLLHAAYTVFDGILLILGIMVTFSLTKEPKTVREPETVVLRSHST
jgi:hypothetical protein